MEKIAIFVSLMALSACVSVSQKLDPAVFYRHDICFKEEKTKFCGVGILPYKDKYKIKVMSYGQLDFFAMATCHREDTTERPDKGIFKKDGNTKIEYIPTIEKDKTCPLYVSAYNKNARHAWGMIAFKNPRFKLMSTVHCNGEIAEHEGVSICQSRYDLIQKIVFNEEVKISKGVSGPSQRKEDCPELKRIDEKTFEFRIPNRECRYAFIGIESRKIHTLYTIGYEEIIVRN